ncbi:MFS general substrate transporter [Mycena sanguinolenta]|uniref:MFS general substrate transporter n=1 Tax=Mycena sanguinolenta TaxID=230812 RepID=A0A8H7DLS8_9AGAR|nr:MFS general substrate transporter [Mycena sanguinolenta]
MPGPNESREEDGSAFPEGEPRAWATVLGAFLVQLCGFGYTTSFGVYQDFYVRDYLSQWSSSSISWIGSVNGLLIISSGLVFGRVYDRGHFRLLMYGGCSLQAFSLFMLSFCQRQHLYQMFLTQGIGLGLGAGMVYVPSIAVVSHYFKKRRTLAMAIVASGSSVGAVINPILLNNLLENGVSFPTAVRASAGLISGLLLIACLLMRPRLPPTGTPLEFWSSVRRFTHDVPYVFATLGLGMYSVAFYFPLFFLQLDAVTHGIDRTFAFHALVILNASAFVGRVTPGFFAHSLGIANMVAGSAGCGSVLILTMIALSNVANTAVLAVLYGFSSGVFIAMLAPLVAALTDDITELGLRMGLFFTIEGLATLVGPPINGALHGRDFVWWRPALFSGLAGLTGFAFFLAMIFAAGRKEHAATEQIVVDAVSLNRSRAGD